MAENVTKEKGLVLTDDSHRRVVRVSVPRDTYTKVKGKIEASAKADVETKRKLDKDKVYSRTKPDEDYFSKEYQGEVGLLPPPYPFDKLFLYYEWSDTFRSCVNVMKVNCHSFGHSLRFLGDDRTEKDQPKAKASRQKVESFLKQVNHEEDFSQLAMKVREDYEVTGNGAVEVVENEANEIEALYHVPIRQLRMSGVPKTPTEVKVKFLRDGKIVVLTRKRYFRVYCQKIQTTGELTFYKEYGDPRVLNALTGDFLNDAQLNKMKRDEDGKLIKQTVGRGKKKQDFEEASSIIWLRQSFGGFAYGIPRWIGTLHQVLGRHNVHAINYNLVKRGGIPQLIVMVSGGTLTNESYNDFMSAIDEWATTEETWGKTVVLESVPETLGVEEKGSAKIDLKFTTEGRENDFMFEKYAKGCEDSHRKTFRFAPLYLGGTEDYNRSVAITSMKVSEQQCFQPERELFDTSVNLYILRMGLGIYDWEYKSNSPRILADDEYRLSFETFARNGCITLNDGIEMANTKFGLDMSKYKEPWGNYPIAFLLSMVQQGKLGDLDDILAEEAWGGQGAAQPQQLAASEVDKKLPFVKENLDKSFSDDDLRMYLILQEIGEALDGKSTISEENYSL